MRFRRGSCALVPLCHHRLGVRCRVMKNIVTGGCYVMQFGTEILFKIFISMQNDHVLTDSDAYIEHFQLCAGAVRVPLRSLANNQGIEDTFEVN